MSDSKNEKHNNSSKRVVIDIIKKLKKYIERNEDKKINQYLKSLKQLDLDYDAIKVKKKYHFITN
jgi:ribosomal protein S20